MVDPIPPMIKNAWEKWNIRGTILLSLSLQIFLIFLAPFRKSTKKRLLFMVIWSAYLLADAAANFTVGLISNSQGRSSNSSNSHGQKDNEDLLAFWAPFLLLHLGGPDTITAFSLEDNELWLRHLLGLGFQAVAAIYVFIQSMPNILMIPTILMFVAGIIKYLERTRALYHASLDKFRDSLLREPDPGPNYAKLMEEYALKQGSTQIIKIPETDKEAEAADDDSEMKYPSPLKDLEVVHYAYKYFQIFKGLVVDLIFDFRERNESRKFFKERKPEDALKVIEIELNLIYEALYTKVEVVHSGWGYMFRSIAFGSILASLGIFHYKVEKEKFNQFDVRITYTLLLGAVALDVLALLMLLFSDRTFAPVEDPKSNKGIFDKIIYKGLFTKISKSYFWFRRPSWQSDRCRIRDTKNRKEGVESAVTKHEVMATPILFSRWSGSLASYNLISYCLRSRPSRIHKIRRWPGVVAEKISGLLHIELCYKFVVVMIRFSATGLQAVKRFLSLVIYTLGFIKNKLIDAINFVVEKKLMRISCLRYIIGKISVPFISVRKFIMELVKSLNDLIDEIMFVSWEPLTKELWEFIFKELKDKAVEAEKSQEEAKFISGARGDWILTAKNETKIDLSNLLQYVSEVTYDESLLLWHIATDLCYYTDGEKIVNKDSFDHREFSKLLSDYMLYLLIMQPTMMSTVGGIGKIRFQDTCAEAKRFFERRGLLSKMKNKNINKEISREARAYEAILSVNTDVKPEAVKGDRSKSVLFDACMLAKELNFLEKRGLNKWKLMSRVWVELISYAASHCRANTHARQLSKGGELLTFTWLLMAHLGLGEQFQINEGDATAKLIAVD